MSYDKEYYARWYRSPAGRDYLERSRARRNERNREWMKTEKGKAVQRRKNESMMRRHPERVKARRKLRDAVNAGTLERLPCEKCGEPRTHGHHTDYSRPLDVSWLCLKHHREAHT